MKIDEATKLQENYLKTRSACKERLRGLWQSEGPIQWGAEWRHGPNQFNPEPGRFATKLIVRGNGKDIVSEDPVLEFKVTGACEATHLLRRVEEIREALRLWLRNE